MVRCQLHCSGPKRESPGGCLTRNSKSANRPSKKCKKCKLGRGRARAADVRCHPYLVTVDGFDAFLLTLANSVERDGVCVVQGLCFSVQYIRV